MIAWSPQHILLGGCFNPVDKYARQIGSFRHLSGYKIQKIVWNHQGTYPPPRKTNSWNLKIIPLKRKLIFQTTIIFMLQNVNKFQGVPSTSTSQPSQLTCTCLTMGSLGVSINSRGSVSSHPQVSPQLLRLDVELCPTLAGCFNPATNIFCWKNGWSTGGRWFISLKQKGVPFSGGHSWLFYMEIWGILSIHHHHHHHPRKYHKLTNFGTSDPFSRPFPPKDYLPALLWDPVKRNGGQMFSLKRKALKGAKNSLMYPDITENFLSSRLILTGSIHTMVKMRMKETSRLHKATNIGINEEILQKLCLGIWHIKCDFWSISDVESLLRTLRSSTSPLKVIHLPLRSSTSPLKVIHLPLRSSTSP